MDEISIIGKTMAAILDDGQITLQELHPEDFGLELVDKELIGSAETMKENLSLTLDVLHGKRETQEQSAKWIFA
jgi:anthranilate phosphoribosyltransferase